MASKLTLTHCPSCGTIHQTPEGPTKTLSVILGVVSQHWLKAMITMVCSRCQHHLCLVGTETPVQVSITSFSGPDNPNQQPRHNPMKVMFSVSKAPLDFFRYLQHVSNLPGNWDVLAPALTPLHCQYIRNQFSKAFVSHDIDVSSHSSPTVCP